MKYSIQYLLFCFLFLFIFKGNAQYHFFKNLGQWDPPIQFASRLQFGNIYFENNQFTFHLQQYPSHLHDDEQQQTFPAHHFKIHFNNANANPFFTYSGKSDFYFNYFLGNDAQKWRSYVYAYENITYRQLYNGIDMQVSSHNDQLKYEFIVQANADIQQLSWTYQGIDKVHLKNDTLVYNINLGQVKETPPFAYQYINGVKKIVPCYYQIQKDNKTVRLDFPNGYDTNYELVIDPTLIFARLSGSSSDNFGFTATFDEDERAYNGGIVFGVSGSYPTTLGAYDVSYNGGSSTSEIDIGISCYNGFTGALEYGTYIGGSGNELPNSMVVNGDGDLLILATVGSNNIPLNGSPYDNTFNGGSSIDLVNNGIILPNGSDIAIFKLNQNGSQLLASTYIGGSGNDGLNEDATSQFLYDGSDLHANYGDAFRGEIIVDEQNNVYISSSTNSVDFPRVQFAGTLLGDQDAVVCKLTPDLDNLLFSRMLGGNNDDAGYSLKIDNQQQLFVVGGTQSGNFPIIGQGIHNSNQGGSADGYIARLNNQNGVITASTYIGTNEYDQVYFVDIDDQDNIYIVGQTLGNYPIQNANFQNINGTQFIHKLSNNLNASIFSTRFGTNGNQIDISPTAFLVDRCERVYVSGWGGSTNENRNPNANTNISNLPVTPNALKSSPSGQGDFYFFVLDKNANGQLYGSFFGGSAAEHVDGGTSRFDRRGYIYQSICAACAGGTFASSGNYSIFSGSNNCNQGTVKIDIGLPLTLVEIDAFPRATGCVPLTVNFNSITEDVVDIIWDFGDGNTSNSLNPTHTYIDTGVFEVMLIGTNINSCNERDTAFLTVEVGDDTIIASQIDTISFNCEDASAWFGTSYDSTSVYNWEFSDGTILNNDSNLVFHQFPSGGVYEVILHVVDSTKCETEIYDTVTIDIPLFFEANISTTAACEGQAVSIQNGSNPDAEFFFWDLGNGTTDTVYEPEVIYNDLGFYEVTVMVVDSGTCNITAFDTALIEVLPAPHAFFVTDTNFYTYPDSVYFTNQSYQYTSHYWSFGDGTYDSTNIDALHFYKTPGDFTPCITAINDGCEDIYCDDLFIDFTPLIGVPNAFSPNQDGVNDIIYVEGLGITKLRFSIYNRWGELVFESYSINEGWDGTYKGILQEMDVYTYVVDAVFIDQSNQQLKGNITLLR